MCWERGAGWLGPSHLQRVSFIYMSKKIYTAVHLVGSQVSKAGHSLMCAISKHLSCTYDITAISLVQRKQVS